MVGATSSSSAWEVVPWRKPGPHGEGPMYLDVDTTRSRYLDTPTYVLFLLLFPRAMRDYSSTYSLLYSFPTLSLVLLCFCCLFAKTQRTTNVLLPRYVFSIETSSHDTRAVGAMIVHHPYARGFRLYVGEPTPGALLPPVSAAFARRERWRVSYIGIEQPRPTRAVLTSARLYGETLRTFSATKKHLFLNGLASALELPPVDVALMSVRASTTSDDGGDGAGSSGGGGGGGQLVLDLRIELSNGAAAAAAVARLRHANFVLRLSKMIKLNTPKAQRKEVPLVSPLTMAFGPPRVVKVAPARK